MKAKLIPELKVTEFKKSLEFYTLIGFEVMYDRQEEGFAMLNLNGAQIMIEELCATNRSWLTDNLEKPFGRGMHFQIEVDDIEAIYAKLKANKHPIFHEMEEKWYRVKDKETGHKQFLVQDADGYLLRFFENLGMRISM